MSVNSKSVVDLEYVQVFAQDLYFEKIKAEINAAQPRASARVKSFSLAEKSRVSDLGGKNVPVVIGSSLVVFDEVLTAEERQIAADSQTFAELSVKRLHPDTSIAQCYKVYNDALLSCGWYSEGFTQQDYVTKKLTITMNEAVLQILETVVTAGSGNVVGLIASGIKDLKGDAKSLKVVETGSKKNNTVGFKAVPCIAAAGGGVSMIMGALDVVDSSFDGDFLFATINTAGVKMYRSAGTRKLNKRLFERKKEQVYEYIDTFSDELMVSVVTQ